MFQLRDTLLVVSLISMKMYHLELSQNHITSFIVIRYVLSVTIIHINQVYVSIRIEKLDSAPYLILNLI